MVKAHASVLHIIMINSKYNAKIENNVSYKYWLVYFTGQWLVHCF